MKATSLTGMRSLILFVAFALLPMLLYAQPKSISGTVKDSSGQALPGATVSLLNADELVVGFAFATDAGTFEFAANAGAVWLEVSLLGYNRKRLRLNAAQQVYLVELKMEAKLLAEVLVKTKPPTELIGDTLKYMVRNFATKEDRTIADVLRRLPGVEIARDGAIYFNGKKIENLYIDGDDLMDGRYGMATKVIKKELIESVDIIRNHQPIAVLKDKVFSDNVALNLVLQNENSLKLSAAAGLGFGLPTQAEVSLSTILLSKKIKTVNRLAYNNAGIDYRGELAKLGGSNFTENLSANRKDINLSLASVSPPDVPLSYYYFNQSAIINFNALYKNKNGVQFKLNANGYTDRSRLNYEGKTISYLLADTITYLERQTVISKPLVLDAGVNVMVNKSGYFLNNAFTTSVGKERVSGLNEFNGKRFSQTLMQPYAEFANDFNWMPSLKAKAIIELRWHTSFSAKRQQLDIANGYFFEIAPQQGFYNLVTQQLRSPLWYNNAYLAYKRSARNFYQEYKVGYRATQQSLTGSLNLVANTTVPYSNDPGNNVTWNDKAVYAQAVYQLTLNRLRAEVQLPLSLRQISSGQPLYNLTEQKRRLFLLPTAKFTYSFDNEKRLEGSYQLQNDFGDITTAYRGAVLSNYLTLQAYTQGLQQQKLHRTGLAYYHQKSIKLFYFNVGLTYTHAVANMLLSDSFSNNIRRTVFIPYQNPQTTFGVQAGVSKYLFKLKTTLALKVQKRNVSYLRLINQELLRLEGRNFSVASSAIKKFGRTLEVNHEVLAAWSATHFSNENKSRNYAGTNLFTIDQRLKLSQNIFGNFYCTATATQRLNKLPALTTRGYFFLDAGVKRQAIVKGLDFELTCNNLFNVRRYSILYQSANQVSSSDYVLRGLTVNAKLNYFF